MPAVRANPGQQQQPCHPKVPIEGCLQRENSSRVPHTVGSLLEPSKCAAEGLCGARDVPAHTSAPLLAFHTPTAALF